MVSVSSQFLKQMFTSAGCGISLSPGTLKRTQNPSLLVGKIEQACRTKQIHQPILSAPILLLLCYSQVKKCVCLGDSETTDKHFRCLWNEGVWRCDEEVVSKAEATKWVWAWDNSCLLIWCNGKLAIISWTSYLLFGQSQLILGVELPYTSLLGYSL